MAIACMYVYTYVQSLMTYWELIGKRYVDRVNVSDYANLKGLECLKYYGQKD